MKEKDTKTPEELEELFEVAVKAYPGLLRNCRKFRENDETLVFVDKSIFDLVLKITRSRGISQIPIGKNMFEFPLSGITVECTSEEYEILQKNFRPPLRSIRRKAS